jgi:hypothetical protein
VVLSQADIATPLSREKRALPPPILNEPIMFFSVDPPEVADFEICGLNSADNGAIKGAAMGGQKGIGGLGMP